MQVTIIDEDGLHRKAILQILASLECEVIERSQCYDFHSLLNHKPSKERLSELPCELPRLIVDKPTKLKYNFVKQWRKFKPIPKSLRMFA